LTVANLLFIFLSLPPPILRHSGFMKLVATARKSLIRFRKIVKKVYHDKASTRCSYKWLSKSEVRELMAADQRNLTVKVSIAYIAAEVENDWGEMSGNSLRPLMCRLKRFMPLFTRIFSSQKVSHLSNQIAFRRDEEGSIENVPGRSEQWSRWHFGHLGQHSHCWRVGWGQRFSWLAWASTRMPPRRSYRVCSGISKSDAKNVLTWLAPNWKKLKIKTHLYF
jgi:hypothetical protein